MLEHFTVLLIFFRYYIFTHTVGVNSYFDPGRKIGLFQCPIMVNKIQSIIWTITGKVVVVQKTWKLQDKILD